MIEFYFYFILIALSVAIAFAFIRTCSTAVHELGHAIPALMFSKEDVKIYIGSHGDPEQCSILKIGRLTIFYKYSLTHIGYGLCTFDLSNLSVFQYFTIIIMGPLTSLLTGGLFFYLSLGIENWFFIQLIGFTFVLSSLYDFYINIKPHKHSICLYNGSMAYNDGRQLIQVLSEGQQKIDASKAAKLYLVNNFEEAANIAKKLIESGYENENIYKIAKSALISSNRIEEAATLINQFKKIYALKAHDYVILGLLYDEREEYDLAINEYNKAIKIDSSEAMTYNNKAYAYIMLGEYKKALETLEKSIELDPNLNYAILNKGLALIHLCQFEQGLTCFNTVLDQDPENPYAIGSIGIYYYLNNNFIAARKNLERSLAIEPKTKIVIQYLEKCQLALKL